MDDQVIIVDTFDPATGPFITGNPAPEPQVTTEQRQHIADAITAVRAQSAAEPESSD